MNIIKCIIKKVWTCSSSFFICVNQFIW